ncbi:MAG: zinc-binding dehydrogenase [Clostridiales bacterium]|nr:zinc-binding dehydrogenase [Clostridiales bacterium]
MKVKYIYFPEANSAELGEREIGNPGAGQIQVKMRYTAVSAGTERANLIGEANVSTHKADCTVVRFPRTSGGYSGVGTVVAVGPGVQGFEEGDIVFGGWGNHCRYNNLPVTKVVKFDPEKIDPLHAAFTNIACFSLAGTRKLRIELGESAMVMGLGLLGLFAVQFCRLNGAAEVIACDPKPERRALAMSMGATHAIDSTEEGFTEKVRAITGRGANAVVEVTGVGAGLNSALDAMARFGRITLLGCTRHPVTVDFYHDVHGKGIQIFGAHTNARPSVESYPGMWTDIDDYRVILKFLEDGRLDFSRMVNEVHSPADCPEVYARLAEGKNFPIGVAFDWSLID